MLPTHQHAFFKGVTPHLDAQESSLDFQPVTHKIYSCAPVTFTCPLNVPRLSR